MEAKAPEIRVDGVRVAAVDKKRAALYLGCPQLVEQMLWAARHQPWDPWVEIVHNMDGGPKTKTLISACSLEAAYMRLKSGEVPPRIGQPDVMEFEIDGCQYAIGTRAALGRRFGTSSESACPRIPDTGESSHVRSDGKGGSKAGRSI